MMYEKGFRNVPRLRMKEWGGKHILRCCNALYCIDYIAHCCTLYIALHCCTLIKDDRQIPPIAFYILQSWSIQELFLRSEKNPGIEFFLLASLKILCLYFVQLTSKKK